MEKTGNNSAGSLIAVVHRLFKHDLAMENDFLRQENKTLRSKLGKRAQLTDADRKVLVKYGCVSGIA